LREAAVVRFLAGALVDVEAVAEKKSQCVRERQETADKREPRTFPRSLLLRRRLDLLLVSLLGLVLGLLLALTFGLRLVLPLLRTCEVKEVQLGVWDAAREREGGSARLNDVLQPLARVLGLLLAREWGVARRVVEAVDLPSAKNPG